MDPAEFLIVSSELREILKNPPADFVLLDVREQEEFDENRIEGCKLIPMSEFASRLNELDPQSDIVIYCAHGVRSLHALMALRASGFKKLRSLEGGIADYLGIP